MSNVLKPLPSLLCKLGSIVVHVEELHSSDGHAFDKATLDQLMNDPEVTEWRNGMAALAFLPVKRKA